MALDDYDRAHYRAMTYRTRALDVHYDRRHNRIVIDLDNEMQLSFPPKAAEGLAGASAKDLSEIEISPSGLGLHWPRLDADLYVPALVKGITGSKKWMAETLGAAGGRAKTPAKAAASRENGKQGGRPRKRATNG
jgi:hypothetical protein